PPALQQFLEEMDRQLEQLPEDQAVLACDGTLRMRRCFPSPPDQKAADSPTPAFDQERYLALWQAREASMKAPSRLWFSPTDSEHPGEEEWSPAEESDLLEGSATEQSASDRETGILVHSYLELHLGEPDFQPKGLDLLATREKRRFEARERAGHILERFFSGLSCDSAGRPYRNRLQECRILARELPVYLQVEGRPWYGVIDLVLESGQGILGVDYKSTPPRRPLPDAYARQRQIYSQALRGLYPDREVSFEFWWLGREESSDS
ncbi:MAG: PD-(D/E)XK nuclease family protein, partial [Acidobacteriota bacterium]